ncbi:MAG: hypothetical protein K0U84_01700 [Actinomycetia bacterium]|nr:hypothetical protein [Actinomycetes bacterium]
MPSKGTSGQRGYNYRHQKLRKQLEPVVAAGRATCWRCTLPITPTQEWDLGHDDHDRRRYRGPEHRRAADCPEGGNRATANRRHTTAQPDASRPW